MIFFYHRDLASPKRYAKASTEAAEVKTIFPFFILK